ncbi:hypothetical protein KIN20_022671 [Parelaphostrongylus tenuis]|uniref:Uncharacterized protein n=1 Tax=Parelaphostrongylus tenuis TaxID=148309 RepID=A0AAD5MQV9_PARTN|nr:hypothetical protein KIN20_022671 [Parelaphostrongylus tenuis]
MKSAQRLAAKAHTVLLRATRQLQTTYDYSGITKVLTNILGEKNNSNLMHWQINEDNFSKQIRIRSAPLYFTGLNE